MVVESVFSMCGMCAVRCPIRVEVEDGQVRWIEGNPHVPGIEGALCAKGGAGIAFENDRERPQQPLIRVGPRGSGQWQKASWEEALDYIGARLLAIKAKDGARAIALADRSGPFTDLSKSFVKALGSPNYFDHDDTCAKNVNLACQSLLGHGRGDIVYDFAKAKHIVLYGRNVFESLQVKEVNTILDALQAGAKLTYIDVRATVTAAKANTFLLIRPGTDYALNLALIRILLTENLYDRDFVAQWVTGLAELEAFVQPYTPEWAAAETGIPAAAIVNLAREVGGARPKAIFHGGWMLSRYRDSFHASRSLYILNVLLGNIESKGGLLIAKGPCDAGREPLHSLGEAMPEVTEKIVDAAMVGRSLGTGHVVNLYKAIASGLPYPIKAFFAYRYDPIASLPDPEEQRRVLDNLELLVSIDVNYSDTGWFADVILPESTYLERANIIATQRGPKPGFIMRRQAVLPRYDSKPAWEIFRLIAERCGVGQYLPYQTIEELWEYQLAGTGVRVEDFLAKGMVGLSKEPILWPRQALKFKTPSGKIELLSGMLSKNGFASLAPYLSPARPEKGSFRLLFGRSAVHTHAQSQNNPYLHEIVGENCLWLNSDAAAELGIADGELVEVAAAGYVGRIKAAVTEHIHPEAVFMLHGFGGEIPLKSRSFQQGLRDNRLQSGLLTTVDPVGGGVAYLEGMVRVARLNQGGR